MASAAYQGLERVPPAQTGRKGAEGDKAALSRISRVRMARNRVLAQTSLALGFTLLFYLLLFYLLGSALIPLRNQIAGMLLLFIVIPLLIVQWGSWLQARGGIAALGDCGTMSEAELASMTTRRAAMRDELKGSKPSIDVMHDEIGDSLPNPNAKWSR